MSRYRVFSTAKRDLGEIADYLGADRPQAAAKLLAQFKAAFNRLAD